MADLANIVDSVPYSRRRRLQAQLDCDLPHDPDLVLVTDLNILAHSNGINWIRQDTGAVIV